MNKEITITPKQIAQCIEDLLDENEMLYETVEQYSKTIDKLQQENKSLKGNCKVLGEKDNGQRKAINKYIQENERLKEQSYINLERNIEAYKIVEDYEQRIKKAVDYIKEHIQKYDIDGSIGDFDEFDMLTKPNYLLNILQNGSENNE